jgi:hypothetical protein
MGFGEKFWWLFQVLTVGHYAAAAIVVALTLSILAVAVSRSPPTATLKRRAIMFAWIALPSAPILVCLALEPIFEIPGYLGWTGWVLCLWTITFGALGLGGSLKGSKSSAP